MTVNSVEVVYYYVIQATPVTGLRESVQHTAVSHLCRLGVQTAESCRAKLLGNGKRRRGASYQHRRRLTPGLGPDLAAGTR